MPSPFPTASLPPGHGAIHLSLLSPANPTFSTLNYSYPLKLLPSTPHILRPSSTSTSHVERPDSPESRRTSQVHPTPTTVPLLFLLTYGGGIVAGDTISLSITLDPSTRLTIATQGSTKIFKISSQPLPLLHSSPNDSKPNSRYLTSHQSLHVLIGTNAALWLGPDPTTPFAGSCYAQKQIFHVARGGSVGFGDWVSEGRRARGESWDLTSWRGRNEIWSTWAHEGKEGRRLLVRDSVILEGENIKERMDNIGIFATVILHGPLFEPLTQFFLEEFKLLPRIGGRNWGPDGQVAKEQTDKERWREGRLQREGGDGLIWTAARVRGCTVIKFGAREVEGAKVWLEGMLKQEGSVVREFGDGALMCVR